MNNRFHVKQVGLKSGKVTIVASHEDYGDAVEHMVALSTNNEKYGYYIVNFG